VVSLTNYNRWQAFASHLGLSFLIFVLLVAIISLAWYPGDQIYFGGIQGIKIVAAIDLVLGPLLTLIIFNPLKKSLPFDLSVIALIQIAALIYGVTSIYGERPLVNLIMPDGLRVIPAKEFKLYEVNPDDIFPGQKHKFPIIAKIDLPLAPEERDQVILMSEFVDSMPIYMRIDLYRRVETIQNENLQSANCNEVEALSSHFQGKVCIDELSGKVIKL